MWRVCYNHTLCINENLGKVQEALQWFIIQLFTVVVDFIYRQAKDALISLPTFLSCKRWSLWALFPWLDFSMLVKQMSHGHSSSNTKVKLNKASLSCIKYSIIQYNNINIHLIRMLWVYEHISNVQCIQREMHSGTHTISSYPQWQPWLSACYITVCSPCITEGQNKKKTVQIQEKIYKLEAARSQ